jgi:hypothetical protein
MANVYSAQGHLRGWEGRKDPKSPYVSNGFKMGVSINGGTPIAGWFIS